MLGQKANDDWFVQLFLGDVDTSAPPDARSLARMHLGEINKRILATLRGKQAVVDETTQAHLDECRERIRKVLSASMQVND